MSTPTNWNGPVLNRYIDADEFTQKPLDEFPEVSEPNLDGPVTKQEAKDLQQFESAERFVTDPDGKKYLRKTQLKDNQILDEYQVFIEQTSDARENDKVRFGEGTTRDEAREDIEISGSSTVTHIGSVREYFETASELSFSLDSGVMVPEDLLGYQAQISKAYRQVTGQE